MYIFMCEHVRIRNNMYRCIIHLCMYVVSPIYVCIYVFVYACVCAYMYFCICEHVYAFGKILLKFNFKSIACIESMQRRENNCMVT